MWRCRCGETNLNSAFHCRECKGSRSTHEDTDHKSRARSRPKTVSFSLFGLGLPDRAREAAPERRRPLSEAELDTYYAGARKQARLMWVVYVLAALAAVGLLVWQIVRGE
jgi:hypothetical protein